MMEKFVWIPLFVFFSPAIMMGKKMADVMYPDDPGAAEILWPLTSVTMAMLQVWLIVTIVELLF